MDESKSQGAGGFFLGLIVGALAGAAIGLLWSPRSGAENRERLADTLPGLGSKVPDAANEATDDLKSRVEEGREAFREGVAETRERMARELDQSRKSNS
jgi:gas vesicle protein